MGLFGKRKQKAAATPAANRKKTHAPASTSGGKNGMLYVRFDIDKLNNDAYGEASYRILFKVVPLNHLIGAMFFMGDSYATLTGKENVCVIGIYAPKIQLQKIYQSLGGAQEFRSVGAKSPVVVKANEEEISQMSEDLPLDGTLRSDGFIIAGENGAWAEGVYNQLRESGEI